jgi:cytochrome c peroxidase
MNVNNALAIVRDYHPTIKVAEIYDEDAEFASALNTLFPDFEYPDFSYLTITAIITKYERSVA